MARFLCGHLACRPCVDHDRGKKCGDCESAAAAARKAASGEPELPVDGEVAEELVWIFIDNSNLWIEGKKFAARTLGLITPEDPRCRVNIGDLDNVICSNSPGNLKRVVQQGTLYGSEPPPLDTIWEKIREAGYKVTKYPRSVFTGREKKVDGALISDVVETVCSNDRPATVILVTGDADPTPAVMKAIEREWSVEVWSWSSALSSDLVRLQQSSHFVTLVSLDDFAEEFMFTQWPHSIGDPSPDRSLVFTGPPLSNEGEVPILRMTLAEDVTSKCLWPARGVLLESSSESTTWGVVLQGGFDDFWRHSILSLALSASQVDVESGVSRLRKAGFTAVTTYFEYMQRGRVEGGASAAGAAASGSSGPAGGGSAGAGDELAADDPEGWETQKSRTFKAPARLSMMCPRQFNCPYGARCRYTHPQAELEYFARCPNGANMYRRSKKCLKTASHILAKCDFYHSESEAWCLLCLRSGHVTASASCPGPKRK